MSFELEREIVAVLPRVRRFAISLSRSTDEADDLVQAACERALTAWQSYTPETRIDSWMYRIVRNLWYDRLRRQRTRGVELEVEAVLDLADPTADKTAEHRQTLTQVWDIIHTLPPEQREVLVLVCVEELSYREAAEVLEIPVGTVMSRLSRARKRVAMAMGMGEEDERSPAQRGDRA